MAAKIPNDAMGMMGLKRLAMKATEVVLEVTKVALDALLNA